MNSSIETLKDFIRVNLIKDPTIYEASAWIIKFINDFYLKMEESIEMYANIFYQVKN